MQIGTIINKLISAVSFSTEVWMSLLLGAVVTLFIAYIIYKIQKKEAAIHLQKHDSRFDELKQLHQQDSEKIKVLYELIIQSQKGSIGEIEAAVLEQKIEVAAEQITEQDSDKAQALKAIAEKDKSEADSLLDKMAKQEHDLAETYKLRAMNEYRNGFYAEAVKWNRKVVELEPDNLEVFVNLINNLNQADRSMEARELALKKLDELDKAGLKDSEQTFLILRVMIVSYGLTTESEQVEPLIIKALELAKLLYGEQSEEAGTILENLGSLNCRRGKFKEGEAYLLLAKAIYENGNPKDMKEYSRILNSLGNFYADQHRNKEAFQLFEQVYQIRLSICSEDHPDLMVPLANLGKIYLSLGKFQEAESRFLEACDIAATKLGLEHDAYFTCRELLAKLYHEMKRYDEAEAIMRNVLNKRIAKEGEVSYEVANVYLSISELLQDQEKTEESEICLRKALDIFQKILPAGHFRIFNTINALACLNYKRGDYTEARQGFLEVIDYYYKQGDENALSIASLNNNLACSYIKQERWAEAEPHLQKAIAYFAENWPDYPLHLTCLERYSEILSKLGRQEEADEYKAKAEELKAKLEEQNTEYTEKTESTKG